MLQWLKRRSRDSTPDLRSTANYGNWASSSNTCISGSQLRSSIIRRWPNIGDALLLER